MNAAAAIALVFFVGPGVDPSAVAATHASVIERLTKGGEPVVDLSAEHRTLFTRSPFVDFTAPPPAFLSPEVAATWKKGNEACAQQTGPIGPQLSPEQRSASAATAHACAWALATAIWPTFLEARGVKRVVSVELGSGPRGVYIFTSLSGPDRSEKAIKSQNVSADRADAEVTRSLEGLLAGHGEVVPVARYAVPSVGVPWVEKEALGEPRKAVVPEWCKKGLPARLEVFPLGKVTRAIEAGYRSVPADRKTAAPLRCDLVLSPPYDPVAEPEADARLTCPPAQYRAVAKRGTAPQMIATLVNGVVRELCDMQR